MCRPYMMPMMDVLETKISSKKVSDLVTTKKIMTLPFAFMRGVSFHDAFVVADEMQNATPEQMRLLITRIGQNTKMVICGDLRQSDLSNKVNGLKDAVTRLGGIDGIGIAHLSTASIFRNPIIKDIEKRYQTEENGNG